MNEICALLFRMQAAGMTLPIEFLSKNARHTLTDLFTNVKFKDPLSQPLNLNGCI
jgi:hypothetical protein